jgi:glyoxylase-like metal-dependent hydrolase (beta-lactamase superfamily II)
MAGGRGKRILRGIVIALVLLVILAVGEMRLSRRFFDAPEPLRDGIMRLHTQIADFYGAKVGRRVVLFDAGADAEGRGLDALLGALHASREDVADIFVTHGHFDHFAAVTLCPRARLHAGQADAAMMGGRAPMVAAVPRLFSHLLPVPDATVTDAIAAATDVPVGEGRTVRAIPFSGHTPGSTLYLFGAVLFVGDSINYQQGKLQPAMSPISTDPTTNRRNIAQLAELLALAEVQQVCTGHQGCTPVASTQQLLADLIARMK